MASESLPKLEQTGFRRKSLSALCWRAATRMHAEIDTVREYGAVIGNLSSLIALGGLAYWCQRCGMWMGDGPAPTGGPPPEQTPPVPQRLIRAISGELKDEPGPRHALPIEQEYSLEPRKDRLHHVLVDRTEENKTVYETPSVTDHSRAIDTYWGGSPDPDSPGHSHQKNFVDSDGTDNLIYLREGPKGTPATYDSGISVNYIEQTGEYEIK